MSRRTPQELASAAAWVRERRARRKREGLCADCGKDKPKPGRAACESCAEAQNRRQTERWHRDDSMKQVRQDYYTEHMAEGLCRCGRERSADRRTCERCYDQKSKRLAA